METESRQPQALIVHDGELEDVAALLDELGAPWRELRGDGEAPEAAAGCPLVLATPRRMLEWLSAPGEQAGPRPVAIAVLQSDSRSLRAKLRRADVHYLVRRPVHPAALRLLLLHALYRGPERRRAERMSVGVPVRYRAGFWRRRAILSDLSMRGCGLLLRERLETAGPLRVYLPPALGAGRTLALRGRVVRSAPAPGDEAGGWTTAVQFEDMAADAERRLRNAVMVHACGPASLPELGDAGGPAQAGEADRDALGDRRAEPRRRFSRRVITLAEEASGVVMGRDLSRGGMRIEPGLEASVGDTLRLALPLDAGETPLVVEARVARDDGERGLVLRFENLSEPADMRLKRMLSYLPICASHPDPDADYADLVVSQLLGHSAR